MYLLVAAVAAVAADAADVFGRIGNSDSTAAVALNGPSDWDICSTYAYGMRACSY